MVRQPARLEIPIPGWSIALEIISPGELRPVEQNSLQPNSMKACLSQPITHFEWLPEMLLDPLEAKLAESEVIELMVVEMGGVLAGRAFGLAVGQCAIQKKHG